MLVEVNDQKYYMEPCLVKALDKIKHRVWKTDNDVCLVVDGPEGSGKSVFAQQLAYYLDPTLTLDRVCMNDKEFKNAIMNADKRQAIIFDEAYAGLSSRASLTAINRILVGKMMECRQKNLFLIIVLPSFFLLDRYVALFRSRALFHIYQSNNKRYWLGFNQKNKKLLYIYGRKLMSYTKPHIYNFRGHFYGKYVLNEEEYRLKKKNSLEENESSSEVAQKFDRNEIIKKLKAEGMKSGKLVELFNLTQQQIWNITHNSAEKPEKPQITRD